MIRPFIKIQLKYGQKLDFEAFPQYLNEHLNNKHIQSLISNLIKPLFKIYIEYCQRLDFKFSPNIPKENFNNRNKK